MRQIKDVRNVSNSKVDKDISFNIVTSKEIKLLLQSLNAIKAAGIDSIPLILVKLPAIPLLKSQIEAIISVYNIVFFPKVLKLPSLFPYTKET